MMLLAFYFNTVRVQRSLIHVLKPKSTLSQYKHYHLISVRPELFYASGSETHGHAADNSPLFPCPS